MTFPKEFVFVWVQGWIALFPRDLSREGGAGHLIAQPLRLENEFFPG